MNGILGTLRVFIEGENKDFLKKLRSSEAAMKNTRTTLNKVGASMQTIGGVLTKGLTVPLAAGATALGVITAKSIAFEKQMKEVFTLLPGITKQGMDAMTADLVAFSKEMGIMPEKTVKPLYDALSAGVPKDNVFEFMRVASKNSVGGVAELSSSVDLLTSILNAYRMETEEAGNVSDILFTIVRKGKTTIPELASTISDVTTISSALKVEFSDVGAALATMTAQGISTAESTTFLKNALNELGKDTSGVSVLFKELTGSTFPEFIAQGNSLGDALQILDHHAQANNTSINNLFGNIRGGAAALALTGENAKIFAENLNEMENAAGATDTAFAKMEESVSRKLDKLKASLYNSIIETGNRMLPLLEEFIPVIQNKLLPAFERFTIGLGKAITKFTEMDPHLQKAILVMTAIAAGAGPALTGIGKLTSGMAGLGKAMNTLKIAGAALFSPAGLLVAGVAAAAAGLVILYKNAQEKIISTEFESVAAALESASLNSENFNRAITDIADQTGLTVGQVLDIADGHGIITDELREQAEVLSSMSAESEKSAEAIAKENYQIKAMLGASANGGFNMAESAKNFSTQTGISLERTVSLALQLENINDTQKEQLLTLQDSIEHQKDMADLSYENLENEKGLIREASKRRAEEEKISQEKKEQVEDEKELVALQEAKRRANEYYQEGYEAIQTILNGEISDTDKLIEKIEYLQTLNWGASADHLNQQRDQAIAILQEQIDAIKQKSIDAEQEKIDAVEAMNLEWKDKFEMLTASRLEMLSHERDQMVAEAEAQGAETYYIKEYYAKLEEDLNEEMAQNQRARNLETASQYVGFFSSALSSINTLFSQSSKNEDIKLSNWYKREKKKLEDTISNEEELNAAIEALDEKHDEKSAALQRKEAKRSKALGIFNAVISGAGAVLNALNTKPFMPLGLAMAALAGVSTTAQVALIAGQPLPALEDGAIIRKTVGGSVVNVGEGGNDEAVLPLSADVYQEIGKGISDNLGSIQSTGAQVGGSGVTNAQIDLYLGEKVIASSTVKLINNGHYILNARSVQ